MISIKGKWALVTGASRGIGALAAVELAKNGCNLFLHSRKVEHAGPVLEQVKAYGVEAYAIAADLENENDVRRMLAEIDATGVDISIVLNNAGIQVQYRAFPEYYNASTDEFVKSLKVNTIAPMIICYHYLPKMISNGFGRIVNTTSGIDKEPEQPAYSASKAALDKVTKDLATTVDGTDVMLNLVDPGWCRTDLGGPKAPNSPDSAVPGVVVGVFLDDKISGRIFSAQQFAGLSLANAVAKVEAC